MISRKPVAPNNRNGVMRNVFLSSLESQAFSVKFPKSIERTSVFHYLRASQRQNGEGFGGGNKIGH